MELKAKTNVKRLGRAILRRMPGRDAAIRIAARLPPNVKRRARKALARVLEHPRPHMGTIETNLGIPGVRVAIGADAGTDYFYGTPETMRGERSAIALAQFFAQRCGVFLDIGAHHGLYVFAVRSQASLPIHFFEPNPDLYREIEANVARMGLAKVRGSMAAIGARTERVEFFVDRIATTNSSIVRWYGNDAHELQRIDVDCTTFDAYARDHGIDDALVKVDIEGAADAFFQGMGDSASRVRYLLIELLGNQIESILPLIPPGMRMYYLNGQSLEPYTGGPFEYAAGQWNWLLCRETPDELRAILPAPFVVRSHA